MTLIKIDPTWVKIEQVYAGNDNFMGKAIYKHNDAYLHEDAIPYLLKAIKILQVQGYRLKVFDAFRPKEAQEIMFAHTPDPDFVARPEVGSNHTRAVALDVTLIDQDDCELDMGTGFDCFDQKSWHGDTGISNEAQRNRLILLGAMISAGFEYEPKEWWHYQIQNARSYPLLSSDHAPGLI